MLFRIFFIIILFDTTVLYSNIADPIFDKLVTQIKTNNELEKKGIINGQNFVLYYNPFNPDVDLSSLTTNSEYLIAHPDDAFPQFVTYSNLLNEYNNKNPSIINSKVKHYVLVIDIAPAVFAKMENYSLVGNAAMAYFNQLNHDDLDYESIIVQNIKDKIEELELNYYKYFSIDNNSKYVVSAFVVNRSIKKDIVNTRVQKREFTNPNDVEFKNLLIEKFNPEIDKITYNGFDYIKTYIQTFIKAFYGEFPILSGCENVHLALQLNSNISSEFIDYYCNHQNPDYNQFWDDYEKSYAVGRSVQFLDFIAVFYATVQSSGLNYDLTSIDPDYWVPFLQTEINAYFDQYNEPNGIKRYPIYLKENSGDHIEGLFKILYHLLFYDLKADYNGKVLVSMIKDQLNVGFLDVVATEYFFKKYSIIGSITKGLTMSEVATKNFYDACSQAYTSGLWNYEDKVALNALITDEKFRSKLVDFYFNPLAPGLPLIGKTATELAESMSSFLLKFEGLDEPIDIISILSNPSSLPLVYSGSSKHLEATSVCSEVVTFKAVTPIDYNIATGNLTFNVEYCEEFNYIPRTIPRYNSINPLSVPASCGCKNYLPAMPPQVLDFYQPVIHVVIKNPTFLVGCSECNNTLNKEHAFVTYTRARTKEADQNISNAILVAEIASLPFTAAELLVAKGFIKVMRGVVFATELTSVTFGLMGDGDFNTGCLKLFGAENTVFCTAINIVSMFVGLGDLVNGVSTTVLNRLTPSEAKSAAAGAAYLSDARLIVGEPPEANSMARLRDQIVNNLNLNGMDSDYSVLYNKLYGLEDLPSLQDNIKLKELIHKYRIKHVGSTLPYSSSINEILLDGLNTNGQNHLDDLLSGPQGSSIINSIVDPDVSFAVTETKLRAFKKLLNEVSIICN